MKIDSVNYICKKLNDDLMNENSIDDYISSSLYDDDFEKENNLTLNWDKCHFMVT